MKMKHIMAIDTATDVLHLALCTPTSITSVTQFMGRSYSEKLVLKMKEMCEDQAIALKDLELIVCSEGPGSFTGLRIGLSAAKGVALAADIPLVSIPTLQIYAYPLKDLSIPILSMIDAKKGRFYTSLFEKEKCLIPAQDSSITHLVASLSHYDEIFVTGVEPSRGFNKLCDEVTKQGVKTKYYLDSLEYRDYGESMIILGKDLLSERGADPLGKGPTYIRKSDAEVSLEHTHKK
jgi:tRNA threonylcarbamoyladenosine biosynthesis protein TsaB